MPCLLGKNPSYRKHKRRSKPRVTLNGRDYYLGRWQSAESRPSINAQSGSGTQPES